MGRFVAHLDDEALSECLRRFEDDDLLRVAFVLEGAKPHERIFQLVGVERMRQMLAAAESNGLCEEASHVLDHLSASRRKQLSGAAKG